MKIPQSLLQVWSLFSDFPMETLTKIWLFENGGPRQRTVEEMRSHRKTFAASGNCFDLALWLRDEFRRAKIKSYGIGDNIGTDKAHVALIAEVQGSRYLCDLGDLWIQPISIDNAGDQKYRGFFAGADVHLKTSDQQLAVEYHRPGGKVSRQSYNLSPLSESDLFEAGQISQSQVRQILVEMRIPHADEIIHWEFSEYKSFLSSHSGLIPEKPASDLKAWSQRIGQRTGMSSTYVQTCLELYQYHKA